tara:strand:- start:1134 stop:2399 length:1266 start_codon:yes stop_codon:yes gene_type:complete
MAIFKELSANDIKTARSFLSQLVDVIQNDISGSSTRRKYQVWVTGGIGPGVTSSLFQTVYDQDFTLQTSNAVFDMTMGLYVSGSTVQDIKTGEDASGKLLFPSTSLMMREKVDIYRQYAQTLLGTMDSQFVAPFNSTTTSDNINEAMFISFKRLFARDQIKRETFAMKFYQTASDSITYRTAYNVSSTSISGAIIFTDVGSAANKLQAFGGQVSNIVDSSNTARTVGLMFNDRGTAILDLNKILSGAQKCSGAIDAMASTTALPAAGKAYIGSWQQGGENVACATYGVRSVAGNPNATFIPDLMTSASIDDIVDHLASARFQSGTLTAITFQNVTNINSTLMFCRATADEFNYSSNPSYIDANSRIVVIDEGQEETQRSFTFVTSVGLYDANDNLLAVAKLSRPVEKNDEKDITFRVRLDF